MLYGFIFRELSYRLHFPLIVGIDEVDRVPSAENALCLGGVRRDKGANETKK